MGLLKTEITKCLPVAVSEHRPSQEHQLDSASTLDKAERIMCPQETVNDDKGHKKSSKEQHPEEVHQARGKAVTAATTSHSLPNMALNHTSGHAVGKVNILLINTWP